jgi:DNA-binding XRE family transcriptional regulator
VSFLPLLSTFVPHPYVLLELPRGILEIERKILFFEVALPMLEMFQERARHPLRELRERANVSQAELARATGLSCTKISLAENFFAKLTPAEEKEIKETIVSLTKARAQAVLSEARNG